MDFRLLRYFIATVEEGSLQGAARRMNIAQPALSRRIRDLELTLGCTLLIRGSRGVTTTPAGKCFHDEAVALVKALDRAIHNTRRIELEQDRPVRLGLVMNARKYAFVHDAIEAFQVGPGHLDLAYMRAPSVDLVEALRDDRLDITLAYERRIRSPKLAERLIHKERYIVAVHPAHPLANHAPIRLTELADQPLIWLARHSAHDEQDVLMQQCRLHGLEPIIRQLSATHEEQLDLASISTGLCLTPASTILSTSPGQFVFRPLTDFVMELDLTLGWVREAANPSVSALMATLHTAIDQHQAAIVSGTESWTTLCGHEVVRVSDEG